MIRPILLIVYLAIIPLIAAAVEAPSGQIHLDVTKVLRGQFVEEHQTGAASGPLISSGHVVVAPAYGLIWKIEKPFPTSTIITPNGAVQDLAGITMKLPVKNLQAIYKMVGAALAGNWSDLENDFVITRSGSADHWQMLLTPRQGGKSTLPYATITISGSRFVENIVMAKADGNYDALGFTDEVLSDSPPSAPEVAAFGKVIP